MGGFPEGRSFDGIGQRGNGEISLGGTSGLFEMACERISRVKRGYLFLN
jgi:hypothetical protein